MNKIDQELSKLKEKLFNEPIVKEYFLIKETIENDKNLTFLKNEMIRLTKENKHIEAKALKGQYDNHPLVNNFNAIKEDVKNLLNEIKETLEK